MNLTHILITLTIIGFCHCNKYSEKKNSPDFSKLQSLEKPFRIQKLNLVWEKASKKLPTEKLKSLYTDLKFQDKEELAWKKQKAEGLDKGGLKESLILNSFKAILEKYYLQDDFKALQDAALVSKPIEEELSGNAYVKNVFRDKKLNKLWLKAEKQGFSADQLDTLKEEFQHHQDKIDQYYQILNQLHTKSSGDDLGNAVEHVLHAEVTEKTWKTDNPQQVLKEKHAELKLGYEYLNERIMPDIRKMEFDEPQVNSLWEMAKNASFSTKELESLKNELHHFEHRIKKLKTLSSMEMEKDGNDVDELSIKRTKKLKEYNYKVEKKSTRT